MEAKSALRVFISFFASVGVFIHIFCVGVFIHILEFYNKNGGQNALLVTMLFFANLLHKLTHLVRIGSDSVIVFNDVINVIMF